MGKQTEDREAARERRRAYYESLSPEEKKAYREKVIRAKKMKRLKKMMIQGGAILLLVLFAVIGLLVQKGCDKPSGSGDTGKNSQQVDNTPGEPAAEGTIEAPDWVIEDFIRIHEDSRPGTAMGQVEGVVLHYTGQPGTSAEAVRKEFDSLDEGEDGSAGSHFIIGIDGTVIQLIPLSEVSLAAGANGQNMISVECCHIDNTGKFSTATYEALLRLVEWLMTTYELEPESVIRHYDATGEKCPLYYVENQESWNEFVTAIGGTVVAPEIPEDTTAAVPEETENQENTEE